MKKQLEILLEQLEDVENPSVAEEQYSTPPAIGCGIAHTRFPARGYSKSYCL